MPKQVDIFFPVSKMSLTAELLEKQAPKTCEAVWSALPGEDDLDSVKKWPEGGRVHHGIHVGPEIYTLISPTSDAPPIENLTYFPIPGDVFLFVIPEADIRYLDLPGELWDFAIFYDRGANLKTSGSNCLGTEGSRFGRIIRNDWDNMLKIGKKIRHQGEENVIIRRKT